MTRSADCTEHRKHCALMFVMSELDHGMDDDREALTEEAWEIMMIEAIVCGDEFFDYDGSMTSVASNSMAF